MRQPTTADLLRPTRAWRDVQITAEALGLMQGTPEQWREHAATALAPSVLALERGELIAKTEEAQIHLLAMLALVARAIATVELAPAQPINPGTKH
jgi:hypothetical protein